MTVGDIGLYSEHVTSFRQISDRIKDISLLFCFGSFFYGQKLLCLTLKLDGDEVFHFLMAGDLEIKFVSFLKVIFQG